MFGGLTSHILGVVLNVQSKHSTGMTSFVLVMCLLCLFGVIIC